VSDSFDELLKSYDKRPEVVKKKQERNAPVVMAMGLGMFSCLLAFVAPAFLLAAVVFFLVAFLAASVEFMG